MTDTPRESVIKTKYAVIAFVVALAVFLGGIGIGIYFKVTSDDKVTRVQEERIDETKARQRQFCRLFVNIRQDRVTRLRRTIEYLDTPAGHESSAINLYIRRISLPQTIEEVQREGEQLPPGCFNQRKGDKSDD